MANDKQRENELLGAEKLREAETALARASSLLKDAEPQGRWYECNRLYHGAHKLAERIEQVDARKLRDEIAAIHDGADAALGAVAASPDEAGKVGFDDGLRDVSEAAHHEEPAGTQDALQAGASVERSECPSAAGRSASVSGLSADTRTADTSQSHLAAPVPGPADEGLRVALRGILDLHYRAERGELRFDEVDETLNAARAALDAAAGCLPEGGGKP